LARGAFQNAHRSLSSETTNRNHGAYRHLLSRGILLSLDGLCRQRDRREIWSGKQRGGIRRGGQSPSRTPRRPSCAARQHDRICVNPQTDYQVNWCALHGHELDRAEDRLERQEEREDAAERDFQDRRERRRREIQEASRRPSDNSVECVSHPDGFGGSRTNCH
jgi:hypothetical protein